MTEDDVIYEFRLVNYVYCWISLKNVTWCQFHQHYMCQFFVQTLFWQLFSSYMYVVKAAKTTFIQKTRAYKVDEIDCWKSENDFELWQTTISSKIFTICQFDTLTDPSPLVHIWQKKWISLGKNSVYFVFTFRFALRCCCNLLPSYAFYNSNT